MNQKERANEILWKAYIKHGGHDFGDLWDAAEEVIESLLSPNSSYIFTTDAESFVCAECRGGGALNHTSGCFDDPQNHCPKCNAYLFEHDGKTPRKCKCNGP